MKNFKITFGILSLTALTLVSCNHGNASSNPSGTGTNKTMNPTAVIGDKTDDEMYSILKRASDYIILPDGDATLNVVNTLDNGTTKAVDSTLLTYQAENDIASAKTHFEGGIGMEDMISKVTKEKDSEGNSILVYYSSAQNSKISSFVDKDFTDNFMKTYVNLRYRTELTEIYSYARFLQGINFLEVNDTFANFKSDFEPAYGGMFKYNNKAEYNPSLIKTTYGFSLLNGNYHFEAKVSYSDSQYMGMMQLNATFNDIYVTDFNFIFSNKQNGSTTRTIVSSDATFSPSFDKKSYDSIDVNNTFPRPKNKQGQLFISYYDGKVMSNSHSSKGKYFSDSNVWYGTDITDLLENGYTGFDGTYEEGPTPRVQRDIPEHATLDPQVYYDPFGKNPVKAGDKTLSYVGTETFYRSIPNDGYALVTIRNNSINESDNSNPYRSVYYQEEIIFNNSADPLLIPVSQGTYRIPSAPEGFTTKRIMLNGEKEITGDSVITLENGGYYFIDRYMVSTNTGGHVI